MTRPLHALWGIKNEGFRNWGAKAHSSFSSLLIQKNYLMNGNKNNFCESFLFFFSFIFSANNFWILFVYLFIKIKINQ